MNFTIDKIIEDNVSLGSVINDCIALVKLFEAMLASGQTARFFAGKFVLWLVLFSKEFVCGQLSTTMVLLNLSRHIQSKVYLLKPRCNRVEIIFTF